MERARATRAMIAKKYKKGVDLKIFSEQNLDFLCKNAMALIKNNWL
jgi:hypothetical protein